MTSEGFAELMGTLWPELIDAMPFGMGRMIRLMGRIPGTLELMKPMFPVLFLRLLPVMMPKVMPAMMEGIAERVSHARLHARTDARVDARSDGQSDATRDRRCSASGHSADDRLSAK